jgi:hypothetical protein
VLCEGERGTMSEMTLNQIVTKHLKFFLFNVGNVLRCASYAFVSLTWLTILRKVIANPGEDNSQSAESVCVIQSVE